MNILTAAEIDAWARSNPRRAQEMLPELMIRLILCTSSKIKDYNFQIENGIQFSGYDGVLDSGEPSSYFPEGKSVWEFGTNDNTIEKFREDIQKRHDKPLGVDVKNTAFIFATLKIWNHKTSIEEVVNESKTKYTWKEIRIVDGAKIALWLQSHTPVAVWFANVIGKHIDGVRNIEDYWNDYCGSTSPQLTKDYFLIGRDSQIEQLSKWLEKKSGSLTLVSESVLESVLFIAAHFLNCRPQSEAMLSKTLIVESAERWHDLIIQGERDCLLLPAFNFTEDIRCPAEMFIILPVAKYSPLSKITKNVESIKIEKRPKVTYHKALESLGYEATDFLQIETETKRSFLPLYRMITTQITRKRPIWLSKANAEDLIPAFLVGGWNGDVEGDRETIEAISGQKYEDFIKTISKWLTEEDAPIFKVFNTYQIVLVQDMWSFLYEFLTVDQIDRFRKCVISVFGTEDPTFELPEEKWAMASLYGKKSKFSGLLCEGLTISLILLSEQKDRENNCNITSAEHYVHSLVREIFEPIGTWRQWNTIASSLMLLTEASPTAFLEKMELEILNDQSEIWFLFKPAKDVLMGRSYYTYILWSLEQLVWYEGYAVRAINLLVAMNEKGFKYTLANCPINTLYEIFCTWYPQCCLNCEQRIKLLKRICKTHPVTGQELINKLIPTGHASCGSIQRPRWHTFETEFEEGVTVAEHKSTLQAIADIALNSASTTEQWVTIIQHSSFFFGFYDSWLENLVKHCKGISEIEKMEIVDSLRSEISRNREFCKADWAMSGKHLEKMEATLLEILPDGLQQYEYLFKHHPHLLHPIPYDKENFDFEKQRCLLREIRLKAIHHILDKYGAETLLEFSIKAEAVDELSEAIVADILCSTYNFPLILKIKPANHGLYTAIIWRLYQANGLEKFLEALSDTSLTDEEKAYIICQVPLEPEIWEKLDRLGEAATQHYWEHVHAFRPPDDHLNYFLSQLLKYNRPFSAARIVVFSEYSNSEMIISILNKCCELQDYTEPTGMSLKSLAGHDILDLFKKLYGNQNVDLDKLVQLEISFLSCFRFTSTPMGIVKYLLENPVEYVNLITYNYKPDSDSATSVTEYSPEQGRLAYEIVDLFKKIPGCDGVSISEEEFVTWITTAQEYAASIGYTRSFFYCLGRLLSYAPVGNDGIFPHEVVRNYFELTHNEKLVTGFVVETQSQRGVHVVTGGLEEKEISNKYREAASKLRMAYPHTSAVLDKLADCYLQESLYAQKQELLDFRG